MIHGLLILDKPLRMSSAQAVAVVRHRAGDIKTGHAGTLDPLATGVLVLALGEATKSIDKLMATEKRYRTTIDLSATTSTDDAEGERCEVAVVRPPTQDEVIATLARFMGEIMQTPPAYSAVKVGGQRAYAIARGGETPAVSPRPVIVHQLQMVQYDWPLVEIDIHCGKGFYVRSLARDLGRSLGVGGYCTVIRRTAVGPYTLEFAKTIEQLPEYITQQDLLPTPV